MENRAPNAVSFDDTTVAFSHKSTKELKFSHLIFRLMGNGFLVQFFSSVTLLALKLHLPIKWAIKATIYKQFCGGENMNECIPSINKLSNAGVGSILDYSVEAAQKEADFERTKNEILKILDFSKGNKNIPFTCIKLTGICRFHLLEKISADKELNAKEKQQFTNSIERLRTICEKAAISGTGLYIDAEESWIQKAIDQMAESMIFHFNKEKAVVYTTVQLYRHDRLAYLQKLMESCKQQKVFLGVKLVRGAYLEKENERAQALNYPTPMQPTKAATDTDYNLALKICVENIDFVSVCAGTHNEYSATYLSELMSKHSIACNHKHVYFSQLYGMSDHISFTLSALQYNVTKYLPYGPVKDTVPYLIRRAQENKSVGGQMGKELRLIKEELRKRAS